MAVIYDTVPATLQSALAGNRFKPVLLNRTWLAVRNDSSSSLLSLLTQCGTDPDSLAKSPAGLHRFLALLVGILAAIC